MEFLVLVIGSPLVFLVLTNLIAPIYKPKEVECTDVFFVSPTIDFQRQDFIRHNILGCHIHLSWVKKDITLEINHHDETTESFIFSNVSGILYRHIGKYDNLIFLTVNRNILGWITHIDLEFYDYENNTNTLLYTIKLK